MKKEKSCGCIVIDDGKVLLIRQTRGHWGFPKGHVEKDETEEETAIRETKEETNIDAEIINNKIYMQKYITPRGNPKKVIYFVAKKVGGEIKPQEGEVTKVEWLSFDEALETLSHNNSKALFKRVLKDNNLIEVHKRSRKK